MRYSFHHIVLLFLFFICSVISAQTPIFDLPLTVSDGAGGTANLRYGIDTLATDGIDAIFGEAVLPPMPPAGVFDARFILPGGIDASLKDYRYGLRNNSEVRKYTVKYQPGNGTAITISWNLPSEVSGKLNDAITGTIIDVSMSGQGSYTVVNPQALTSLIMTIRYPNAPEPLPPPVLLQPVNGAVSQPIPITLSWSSINGITRYQVQVSDTLNFSRLVYWDSSVTSSQIEVASLNPATTYYWRVRGYAANVVCLWSTVWKFTTRPMPPSAPTLNHPANGSAQQPITLDLTWNAVTGADSYELQTADNPNFSNVLIDDTAITTTSKSVNGLQFSTTYYWRVRAKNSGGAGAWSSVWSFGTVSAPIGLLYDIPISVTDNAGGSQTLRLGIAPDATDGIDPQYGEAVLPPLPPAGVFDARFNLPSTYGASIKDYRAGSANTIITKVHELQFQTDNSNTISISWNLPLNVQGRLQDVVTGTLINVPMTGTGSYTVQNPASFPRLKITIDYPGKPPAPVNVFPANGMVSAPVLTLLWNRSQSANTYQLQVSKLPDFSSTVFNDTGLTENHKLISGLDYSTSYYWRVKAVNTYGGSPWSEISNFNVIAQPQGLAYSLPLTVSDNAGGSRLLTFGIGSDATDGIDSVYNECPLQPIPPTGTFDARLVLDSDQGTLNDFRQGAANTLMTRIYKLRFQPGAGNTIVLNWSLPAGVTGTLKDYITGWINIPMSGTGSYTVQDPSIIFMLKMIINYPGPPSPPVLLAPGNGALTPTITSLVWHPAIGAGTYHLQVSTDPLFNGYLINDSLLTDTLKQLSGLYYSTTYYWRVRAKNFAGTSDWSEMRTFTTAAAPSGLVYDLPLVISDMAGGQQAMRFGLAADATDGIDTQYGEAPLPPVPPSGVFDARFNLPSGIESSYKDYRQGTALMTLGKVHRLQYQPGSGTSIKISWNIPDSVTARLNDLVTGTIVDVPMTGNNSYIVTDPSSINQLKITVKYTGGVIPPAVPVLISPVNGAGNQPLAPTLSWGAAANAAKYHVQAATDLNFTNIILNDSAVTSTSLTVQGLQRGTTYYWRVRAANNSGYSLWSSTWYFTTLPAIPNAPVLFSPFNGASNQPLQLQLQWIQSPGSLYFAVEVSLKNDFSTIAIRDTAVTMPSLDISGLIPDTTYYWRVNARNSGGTSPWSTVFKFTTLKVILPAPVLQTPANGASNLTLPVYFYWNLLTGASEYQLQVATDSAFSATLRIDTLLTDNFLHSSLLQFGTTYYWRVRARNSYGWGTWSAIWRFTMKTGPAGLVYDIPLKFTDSVETIMCYFGLAPDATDSIDSQYGELPLPPSPPGVMEAAFFLPCDQGTYTLRDYRQGTYSTTGPTVYQLVFSPCRGPRMNISWNLPQGVFGILNDMILGNIISQPMSGPGQFDVPTWCTKLKMTIYWLPSGILMPPLLSAPVNNSVIASPVNFKWRQTAPAYRYHLQISTSVLFNNIVYDDSTITDTSKIVSSLTHGTLYCWRVRGIGPSGAGIWSSICVCTPYSNPPAATTLINPLNGAVNQPLNALCAWKAIPFAEGYKLQVALDNAFSQIVFSDSGFADTVKQISGLQNNTLYFWRVQSYNVFGSSPWSDLYRFSTIAGLPQPVILAFPVNGATGISTSTTLKWFAGAEVINYHLQLALDSLFINLIVNDSMLTDTVKQITGLQNDCWYYWRVRGRNASATGDFSSVWKFKTALGLPGAPILVSPINGVTRVPIQLHCVWRRTALAEGYTFEMAVDNNFNNIIRSYSQLADTTQEIDSLQYDKWYYWRVKALNGSGGVYSAVSKFRTASKPIATPYITFGEYKNNAIVLTWNDNSDNEYGFAIFRKLGGDTSSTSGFVLIDTTASNVTTYRDSTVAYANYAYKILAYNGDTASAYSNTYVVYVTSVENEMLKPEHYGLSQNYPNPFNPVTVIDFNLLKPGYTTLRIYDFLGRVTAVLVDKELNAGAHSVKFDAGKLNSGVYFYELKSGSYSAVKKLILMK